MTDKRDIIVSCLQDRHTSADAILNALHQGGWRIAPKDQYVAVDALRHDLDVIDWYRRCLEDVRDGRPVRGLDEAKHGYDAAMKRLASTGKEVGP